MGVAHPYESAYWEVRTRVSTLRWYLLASWRAVTHARLRNCRSHLLCWIHKQLPSHLSTLAPSPSYRSHFMSPIPLPSVSQEGVLGVVDAVGYIAVGYILAELLHGYFSRYRQWVAGIFLLPLSPAFKRKAHTPPPSKLASADLKPPRVAEAVRSTSGAQFQGARSEGYVR